MFPISIDVFENARKQLGIVDITTATIRQIADLANALEKESGEKFIHLELGNPGLPAEQIGVEAECNALQRGVANQYPNIAGIPELKNAGKRFLKAFLNIDLEAKGIIPTVGSMQGSFTLYMLLKNRLPERNSVLLLYPGFPAQLHQAKVVGLGVESFDIYNYRGAKLREKLESEFQKGTITAMLYSNPNNPAWTNLTEEELSIIGELCTKYDVIAIEDTAYMGMDFRQDFSHPGKAPFIPTVAHYTDNYIILMSASKIFSYAGQRIACVCMSPEVYNREYKHLSDFFEMKNFGDCYIFGILYCASSGTSHSAQHAMAAMLDAAADRRLPFVEHTREYGRRAAIIKKYLADNGFHIVYDIDGETPISDGFFFTAGYRDMDSRTLQRELMRHGISSISLPSTGSKQNGVRICVSAISDDASFQAIEQRLKAFADEHK